MSLPASKGFEIGSGFARSASAERAWVLWMESPVHSTSRPWQLAAAMIQ